jgi:DNA-binding protein HU-beta
MNRKELVTEVAKRTEMAMSQINHLLDNVLDTITDAMANGREVAVKGFGTFAVAKRAARVGRNPQTGAKIKINASKAPKFRPSSQLKDAVRSGKKVAKKKTAKKAAPKAKKAKK